MRRLGPLLVAAALLLSASAARAEDVIHLKNGGVIRADSWEERGDVLLIRQGTSRLTIPLADVARIEAAAPTPTPAQAAPETTAPAATPAPAALPASPTDDELRRAVDDLKARIDRYPLARAENTRRLVLVLDQLGASALRSRDYDAALARFREAAAYDPKDAKAQLGLAVTYVRTDQDIFARSTLERALLDHPQDADMRALLGDVYYGQERIDEALAEWQKAYDLKPSPPLKAKIDKATRERSIDGSYRQSDAAHFTLKYDGERAGADLGGQIVDYLEGRFRELETRFDHYPLQPIVVVLYPHRQFYEATQAESNVAGLYDGKIRVPIGGLTQLDASARRVLAHELAHAFIAGKSGGAAPRWIHEGLAQVIEGRTTSTSEGTALAKEFQALPDKGAWGERFSYPSALSFVEYLVDRLGFPTVVDILGVMAKGKGADVAVEDITRYSLRELRQSWGESLAAKYLH